MNHDEQNLPFGYAVVNDQGYFVGIWHDEQIAVDVCKKGNPAHNQKVVPVYTRPEAAQVAVMTEGAKESPRPWWRFCSTHYGLGEIDAEHEIL